MALPIVQEVDTFGENDTVPDSTFIHWYRAERRSSAVASGRYLKDGASTNISPAVAIIKEEFYVLPIWAHISMLLELLREKGFALACGRKLQHLRIGNAELVGATASDSAGHEFMFFVSFDYPVTSPIVLFQKAGGTDHLAILWNGMKDPTISLTLVAQGLDREWRPKKASKYGVDVFA